MRLIMLSLFVGMLSTSWLAAQSFPVTPATPEAFKKRDIGSGLGGGVVGVQRVKTKAKTIQYIAVSEPRPWKNKDGKVVTASLIAFEEGLPEEVKRPLTLVKDGKIRLLVSGKSKASLLSLTKLDEASQDFVKAVDAKNKEAAKEKDDDS